MSATRFRFPLARLLALRERRERDAAITLAAAREREVRLEASRDKTAERRTHTRDALMPAPGKVGSVADMYNVSFLLEQLDAHAVVTTVALTTAAEEAANCHATLVDRVRERRVLERLRDRQLAEWRTAADMRERDAMDAIAQVHYAPHHSESHTDD